MGRIVAAPGHMALLPAGAAYRFHADAPSRHPPADHRGRRHRRALGRDLPVLRHEERTDDDRTETAPVQASEPNAAGLPRVHPRRLPLPPRRVLRPHHLADRQPRHERRRLPARPAARRGVGLLLRHRQLRRRLRHGQPLRHRRPVRRPLQRRLPQGRARPRRELRRRRSSATRSRRCSTTGPTPASTPSPARPRPASRSASRTAPTPRPSPAAGSPPSAWSACPATRRSAPTPPTRSTACSPTSPRTSPRSTPSPASRTRWRPSTCSPTSSAPTSRGTRRVVSVCKDSLYCPTTEEYILPIIHGNDRVEWFVQLSDEIIWDVAGPRHRRAAGQGHHEGRRRGGDARPTSATRATRPSARCCWSGRTTRPSSPS